MLAAGYIYVGLHVSSAGILNGCWLTCFQWGYIYVSQHVSSHRNIKWCWLTLTVGIHICQPNMYSVQLYKWWLLTHLQRGYMWPTRIQHRNIKFLVAAHCVGYIYVAPMLHPEHSRDFDDKPG